MIGTTNWVISLSRRPLGHVLVLEALKLNSVMFFLKPAMLQKN